MGTPVNTGEILRKLKINRDSESSPLFWDKTLGIDFRQGEGSRKSRIVPYQKKLTGKRKDLVGLISPLLEVIFCEKDEDSNSLRVRVKFANTDTQDTRDFYALIQKFENVIENVLIEKFEQNERYIMSAYHRIFEPPSVLGASPEFEIYVPFRVSTAIYVDNYSTEIEIQQILPGTRFNVLFLILGPPLTVRRKTPNPYIRLSPLLEADTIFFLSKDDLDSVTVPDIDVFPDAEIEEMTKNLEKKEQVLPVKYRGLDGEEHEMISDISSYLMEIGDGYVSEN